jgi:antitoxin component of RelBE/YafQ-DinJ toxin-antitoxin module
VSPEKKSEELKESDSGDTTKVITVRIDKDLNENLDLIRSKIGLSKADLIRNYLEMAKYVKIQKSSIKSLNDRDLIMIKKSFLRKLIESSEEDEQINLGLKLSRLINDIARINNKLEDINYKLDLCDHMGFFPKFIDEEKYILITKKFGPKKFIEAFTWQLFKKPNQKDFNPNYTSENIASKSSIRNPYNKEIVSVDRSSSHYSFEFAKIPVEESE